VLAIDFMVNKVAGTWYDDEYSSCEGYALCDMQYALIFSGTWVVPTSKLCVMRCSTVEQ